MNLMSEANPIRMLLWLSLLVAALHFKSWYWLIHLQLPSVNKEPPPPEITLLAVPLKQAEVVPEKPKPIVKPEPKPLPPKPKPKPEPVVKPKPVQATKPIAPTPQVINTTTPEPAPATFSEAPTPPAPKPVPVTPPAVVRTPAPPAVETYVEANYHANYAYNPKPVYPASARNRHLEGKVLLRVRVSEDGVSEDVSVEQSSGHEILDESAVEAVQQWKFVPARRGDKHVACTVTVPIVFKLSQ